MALFVPLRLKISNFLLKRKLRHFEREVEFRNIQDCKSVLIISDLSHDVHAGEIGRLTKYFKQMNADTKGLFFIGKTKDFGGIQESDIQVFGNDDLNWLFKPKNEEVLNMLDQEFDLCIDLSMKDVFPLKFIFTLSKARLRVGALSDYKEKYGDFTIDVSKKAEISYLITQIKHYLSAINQKVDVA